MEKSIVPPLNTSPTRLSFIEKTMNMNEKLLLSKLNSSNTSDQNDMLEFLYNNNSTIHSSNQKIIQGGSHSSIKDNSSYGNVFDKALDNYIMQYSLFPFIETDSNDKSENSNGRLKEKKTPPSSKCSRLKSHRAMKIDMYLERQKAYNKNTKHQKGLSCFACFGQRINFNHQQPHKSPSTYQDNESMKMLIGKDMPSNHNHNDPNTPNHLQNTDNVFIQKPIMTDLSTNQIKNNNSGNSNSNINMNEILNLKDNSISIPISNYASSHSEINAIPISNKAITFLLTNDIVKCLAIISKSSNEEYITHSYTYLFDRNAFVNDLYFYELKLRTNIEKGLQSKNIKYPLVLYGNVFVPQVVFFRGDEEVNFKLLDYPVVSPMIIGQLIPDCFANKNKDIQTINCKIIEEALTLSDDLDYETVLVNLLPIAEVNQIFSVIKNYIDILNTNKSLNNNSVNFLLNMTDNQFQSYVNTSGVPQLLEKTNIKTTIITL